MIVTSSRIIDTNVGSAGEFVYMKFLTKWHHSDTSTALIGWERKWTPTASARMLTYCVYAFLELIPFIRIDPTLNATAFAILRYGSNSTSNTSNPTSLDWTDVLGVRCIDLVDADLVPLVPKNAPSVVDQRVAFDSQLGTVSYANVSYSRFLFNQTTYGKYCHAALRFTKYWYYCFFSVNYIYQPFLETVANNKSLNSTNVLYAEFPDDVGTGDIIVSTCRYAENRRCLSVEPVFTGQQPCAYIRLHGIDLIFCSSLSFFTVELD